MKIRQYKALEFRSFNFYPLDHQHYDSISFVYLFFNEAYVYIQRDGVLKYIHSIIDPLSQRITEFEMIQVGFDDENNLIYLLEGYFFYRYKPTTVKIESLLETSKYVELCRMNFFEYAVMSKNNFIHIILSWDKIWNFKDVKFALLYQDDQGWYDVMPFESQEEMDEFIAQHTPVENLHE